MVELDSPPIMEEVYISSNEGLSKKSRTKKWKTRDAVEENKLGSPDIPATAPSPEGHAVCLPDIKASLIKAN